MSGRLVIALDGHDGSGKTTLANALAARLGGKCLRPFAGDTGAQLLRAGERQDTDELLRIGGAALDACLDTAGDAPLVLDRAWMTVASFVPGCEKFFRCWRHWIPTTLCWADLATTLVRLGARPDESDERLGWHEHYLSVYRLLAERSASAILRTDRLDPRRCVEKLHAWAITRPVAVPIDALDIDRLPATDLAPGDDAAANSG